MAVASVELSDEGLMDECGDGGRPLVDFGLENDDRYFCVVRVVPWPGALASTPALLPAPVDALKSSQVRPSLPHRSLCRCVLGPL